MAANCAATESIEAIFCVNNLFNAMRLLSVKGPAPVINGKLPFVVAATVTDDDSFESLSQSNWK